MQYFKPNGDFFVGDCMPFYHQGVFHLFYLLDENHHQGNNGLGGHQWAHASTADLKNWEHHQIALPVEHAWEGSICTGSVLFHDDIYYAFYAIRKPDKTQHICYAKSCDGIHFEKYPNNPILSAPDGYLQQEFRDPFVFRDASGAFNMLVTSKLRNYSLHGRGGCLLRYISNDLKTWDQADNFLIPGGKPGYGCIPECPDIFHIGDWYYLLFGLGLETHYRMARDLMGPWSAPADDILGSSLCAVMKTAAFGENRRIGVCWTGTRVDDRDNGRIQWAGHAVFREIIQYADGTLGTRMPVEMIPSGNSIHPKVDMLTTGVSGDLSCLEFNACQSQEVVAIRNLPQNYRLNCQVRLEEDCYRFGFGLRGSGDYHDAYDLVFNIGQGVLRLVDQEIYLSGSLNREFNLDIICKDSLIDVCVNNTNTIINRLPQLAGDTAFVFCQNGKLAAGNIIIKSI